MLLAASAATFDRTGWPGLVGDEATYLMAAQSLAFDFDFAYTAADYERFVATVGVAPEGLILQSDDGGASLVFGKPLFYPLAVAPFVRLLPVRGTALANAVLLALAAVLAARALRRRFGPTAPLVVASLVFGSVMFAQVFWAHSDLFLACLVTVAFALVERREQGDGSGTWRTFLPLVVAAALLATVAISRPFYAPLALALGVLLVLREGSTDAALRSRAVQLFAVALAATLGVHLLGDLWVRGSWSAYSGERQGFYSYTGFPEVGEGTDWRRSVGERGSNSWTRVPLPFGFDAAQTSWNLVYVVAGRHTGVLPYFFPWILVVWGMRLDARNLALLAAVAAVAVAFVLVRPYNFYGGGGALANRYLLPALPALWFLRGSAAPWRMVPALLGAALFMTPLWAAPRGYLLDERGGYRYVSTAAQRVLPHETTQNHLKPAGREDFVHAGLWVKPLGPRIAPGPMQDGQALAIRVQPGDGLSTVLLGSRERLTRLGLEPSLGGAFDLRPARRAVHRMWWSDGPVYLYEVDVLRAVDEAEARATELLVRLQPHFEAATPDR